MEHIVKAFPETLAVDDFTETFEEGKLTALLGPSGCGKSTLLNMIAGILRPTSGTIFFGDQDVTRIPMEKRNVSIVFQNYALYPHMTALENICFPLEMQKVNKAERLAKAQELAELVKITDYLHRRPGQLSGGQQQRVAIARALAKNPSILLLDEPLSNLDARLRLEMRDEIRRIQLQTKVTTVFVTHDQSEALSISDRIFLMRGGKIQQVAKPQEIYEDPRNLFVATFMGNPPICVLDVEKHDENLLVAKNGTPIRYQTPDTVPCGKPLKLGFRAESLLPAAADDGHFSARVEDQFTIGRDDMLVVEVGGVPLRLFADSETAYPKGGEVSLRIKKRGFYIFDAETELRYL